MWDALGEDVTYDVLVIGGGINGAGIARDAARRGLKVAVVEQKDLAYGTSSRSSKLVHGGLRYLEQLEFSLVFESVSERRILLDIAPHMVNPLGFLFPVYKKSRRGLRTVNVGMWVYEGLSLFRSPKRHKTLKPEEIAKEEPALRQENLNGAPLYYDCSTDDARLTLESALDAVKHGAIIATWARAVSFLKTENGRVCGAVVKDQLTGDLKEVKAHTVINATGPWTDRTIAMSRELTHPLLRPTKGVHIVVDRDVIPVNNSVVCFHPEDRRVLFAIPWGDRTYLGTTDTDYEGDPGQVIADRADVDYLIAAADFYFPDHPISYDDVICTWAGLRPLISPGGADGEEIDESAVSREHQIIVGQDGLITIAGGKLTTYRRMSAEVVDTAVKMLRLADQLPEKLDESRTDVHPLPGGVGWPPDDDHSRVAREVLDAAGKENLSEASAKNLAGNYGMLAIQIGRWIHKDPELGKPIIEGRPEVWAQLEWAVEEELAATVTDFMVQRTQIFYRDHDQGLGVVDEVARRMGKLLDWDEEDIERNIEQYRHDVDLSRQWRIEPSVNSIEERAPTLDE
jgi:glycerol-3-phosphate dehydrogenase